MNKLTALLSGDGLRSRSIRASGLTFIGFGAQNIIRLGGNLILTRILFPEAFGIMALVQVFITGLEMFSDIGVNTSIIQNKRGHDPAFLNTAWTVQIIRGLLLWGIVLLAAPSIADFYDVPVLAALLPVAGLTVVLAGFNSTKLATANKELTIGTVITILVVSQLVGLICIIVLALSLKSVWALAIGGLAGALCKTLLSHFSLPGINNRLYLERAAFGELFSFGKYIFLATLSGFLIAQADRAILGKYVSLEELALYQIAFFLATVPIVMQRQLASKVLFPLYSKRPPSESSENRSSVGKARMAIVGAILTLSAILAVFGNDLVILLYDPRYEAAGLLLVLIALSRLPAIVTGNYGQVLLASGASGKFAAQQIIGAVLNTLLIFLGVIWYGAPGVAIAPFLTSLLMYPVLVRAIRPYNAWMPWHDAMWAGVALGVLALALWMNWPELDRLLLDLGVK
ncbi:MAG: oligosaccharide flippase family protein [Pseudomonadota bacterium]